MPTPPNSNQKQTETTLAVDSNNAAACRERRRELNSLLLLNTCRDSLLKSVKEPTRILLETNRNLIRHMFFRKKKEIPKSNIVAYLNNLVKDLLLQSILFRCIRRYIKNNIVRVKHNFFYRKPVWYGNKSVECEKPVGFKRGRKNISGLLILQLDIQEISDRIEMF